MGRYRADVGAGRSADLARPEFAKSTTPADGLAVAGARSTPIGEDRPDRRMPQFMSSTINRPILLADPDDQNRQFNLEITRPPWTLIRRPNLTMPCEPIPTLWRRHQATGSRVRRRHHSASQPKKSYIDDNLRSRSGRSDNGGVVAAGAGGLDAIPCQRVVDQFTKRCRDDGGRGTSGSCIAGLDHLDLAPPDR